ncbi:TetR/AcrR family transcriptional regulator [Chryseobacterium taiwanense]|uniref:Transcriptional regulator n=1 Tax=Chryseobacterium taiwanense TaxID=363331 RepID=A0A0B4CN28_9FLAO|nr:TetR/AcrR family transcriptional regulator [Chryseobacterium taiwanense]KIC62674.1 transcriptional regulator [Chryseobacterium taiwanense]
MNKSERTRQDIIEKTAVLFNEQGFAGTSYKDLVNATGLSKGCIYGHFESKDEIALAVFDYNIAKLTNHFGEKISGLQNSIDRLLVYPTTLRNFLTLPAWQGGCPIVNTSSEADDTHPLLKDKASKALISWQKKIEHEIVRGIERGEIKSTTDVTEMAVVIVLMIEGAVMQTKVTGRLAELNITMGFVEKLIRNIGA